MKLKTLLGSISLLGSVILLDPGCTSPAECDCAISGAMVDVSAGITANDIQSIAANGPCGPIPRPLCGAQCDVKQQETIPWEIIIPGKGAGICDVVVTLADGRTFRREIMLQESDGCCAGFFGDARLEVGPEK